MVLMLGLVEREGLPLPDRIVLASLIAFEIPAVATLSLTDTACSNLAEFY
jgi:hypothetical protein